MKINIFIKFFLILLLSISCSKQEIQKSKIKEKSLDLQMLEAYDEGFKAMEGGDVFLTKNLMKLKTFPNQHGHLNQL